MSSREISRHSYRTRMPTLIDGLAWWSAAMLTSTVTSVRARQAMVELHLAQYRTSSGRVRRGDRLVA